MPVSVTPTKLPEVLVVQPRAFTDERGFFFESFNGREFRDATGIEANFVQDNHSGSSHGVLRGLHYQVHRPQAKLVRALVGEVFDVAVDIRRDSLTYGSWVGVFLSGENRKQLWIPPGFAHGFLVMSKWAEVAYKVTDYYVPDDERVLRWNDEQLNIEWPISTEPILSLRDRVAPSLTAV